MKTKPPFFTVLLCVNKKIPFLDDAINSILNQTYIDFEFIIIANNCNDELWGYLVKLSTTDTRVKIRRTSIGQLSFNLNYGLDIAEGEYVARMDADDISESNRLEQLRDIINVNNCPDIVGSGATLIDENGQEIGELIPPLKDKDIKKKLVYKNIMIHPSVAFNKNKIRAIKGYLGGFNSEDYELWLRARREGLVFFNTEQKLLKYRINPFQIKGSKLAHAESLSYKMRELVMTKNISFLWSLLYGICKFVIKSRGLK